MFEARFQSFELEETQPAQTAARVAALRAELSRRGLDGFVLPRADRQQNEYVPPSEERLAWLTGFSGSAAAATAARPGGVARLALCRRDRGREARAHPCRDRQGKGRRAFGFRPAGGRLG